MTADRNSNGFHRNESIGDGLRGDYSGKWRMMWKRKERKKRDNECEGYDVGRDGIGSCCSTP